MSWLHTLLAGPASIAYVLLVFMFTIALGMALGKIRIYGISFGVACVLFVALVVNALGVHIDPTVLEFIRNFGLMLFVFLIGLEVGPSFSSFFTNERLHLNIMMIVMVALSILLTLFLFFAFSDRISLAQILGVHFGAITCTAGLGATQEVLNTMGYKGENITVAYACAYPLSILGVIGSMIFIKVLFKLDAAEEERILEQEESAARTEPVEFYVTATNLSVTQKTLDDLRSILNRTFVCSQLLRNGEVSSPSGKTVIEMGDRFRVVAEPTDRKLLATLFGEEEAIEESQVKEEDSPLQSLLVRVTQEQENGKLLSELHLEQFEGLNVVRVYRSGLQLFPHNSLRIQLGDALECSGPDDSISRFAERLGNKAEKLDRPNIVILFFGMVLGVLLGSLPLALPGIPVPLKLGLAGGSLLVGILLGRYGPSLKLITYTTHSANLMLRELGLALFLAGTGFTAGENFADAIVRGNGPLYVVFGLMITMLPCMLGGIIARLRYHMNFHLIMGLMAGATTNAPTLAYAGTQSEKNTAVVAYATVYPLATFIRILSGQVILALMWMYV